MTALVPFRVIHMQTYLTLSHSEKPKLYAILAFLSAIGLMTNSLPATKLLTSANVNGCMGKG